MLLLVITPVSKMGSLPGGCDGAAGLLALGVGGADRFDAVLILNVLDRCDDPLGLLGTAARAVRRRRAFL